MGPNTSYKWREITPISKVSSPQLPIYNSIYRGEITPFINYTRCPPGARGKASSNSTS